MGQFFKQVFSSCLGTLLGLTLFSVLGLGSLIALIVALSSAEKSASVSQKTMLVLDLSRTITDTPEPLTLAQALRNQQGNLSLRQVLEGLRKASKDEQIVGIFLWGKANTGSNGYATLTEVRKALEKFQAAGKKVIAYDVNWSEKDYYLASGADTIVVNPLGMMEFNGLSTEPLFLKGALDKYGIGVQVVKVGSYKGAVEPYTRENLSPENREQTQVLLNDIWRNFLETISRERQQDIKKLQALADTKAILRAKEAQEAGLVDKLAYFDQVVTEIRLLTGQEKDKIEEKESFRQIYLGNYGGVADNAANVSPKSTIAVVYAEGEIVEGMGERQQIGGDRLAREIRQLREQEEIKAVVLRINSPGGSAIASDVIHREIYLLNQKKPVIVSMGNVAASGGYWLATGAREIFAEKTTLTGSIGVFGLLFNLEEIAKDNGLQWDLVKTGKLAALSSGVRPKTETELKIYQTSVNQIYDLFIDRVASARKLPPAQVKTIAQGRVWSGERAKALGLVDKIGGLEMAIASAAKTANLGDNWQVEEYPQPRTFESEFFSQFLALKMSPHSQTPLTAAWLNLEKELEILTVFNAPQGIYSRLPFNLEIK